VAYSISLQTYVRRRNGVPLGSPDSLKNMLTRSLGAGSFDAFWQYWNPIWGYYLSRYVMKPVNNVAPSWLAILCTFLVSGLLHDIAISLVKWEVTWLFTPWFGFLSLLVIAGKVNLIRYDSIAWPGRALINSSQVVAGFMLTRYLLAVLPQ